MAGTRSPMPPDRSDWLEHDRVDHSSYEASYPWHQRPSADSGWPYYGSCYYRAPYFGRSGLEDVPSTGNCNRGYGAYNNFASHDARDLEQNNLYEQRPLLGEGLRGPTALQRGAASAGYGEDPEGNDFVSRFRRQAEHGPHAGRGPKSFQRADERIRDDINDHLTASGNVDATEIDVTVNGGFVALTGTVNDRYQKHVAEDIADSVPGVRDVQNQLRVIQTDAGRGMDFSMPGGRGFAS